MLIIIIAGIAREKPFQREYYHNNWNGGAYKGTGIDSSFLQLTIYIYIYIFAAQREMISECDVVFVSSH